MHQQAKPGNKTFRDASTSKTWQNNLKRCANKQTCQEKQCAIIGLCPAFGWSSPSNTRPSTNFHKKNMQYQTSVSPGAWKCNLQPLLFGNYDSSGWILGLIGKLNFFLNHRPRQILNQGPACSEQFFSTQILDA